MMGAQLTLFGFKLRSSIGVLALRRELARGMVQRLAAAADGAVL
jgi:hypothetical protein